MKANKEVYQIKNVKKGILLSLKITMVIGTVFLLIFRNFSLNGIMTNYLISALYSFGLGFGIGVINDWLSDKWDWVTQTNQRVAAGIITTVLYTVPVVLLIDYIIFIKIYDNNIENFFRGNFLWIHLFYIILALGVSAFLHARGFMIRWKESLSQEKTQHQIVAKTESAKFETLKSQIDPHFLFNSLNVLTSLIGENPHQAEKFTTKLSKIYRYVLEQRNKELTPLTEELKFAKTYMELLQMRFEDAVIFHIPTKVSNSELKIVPLSLQLLLENAVKHNVVSSSKPLKITMYEKEGFLWIENNVNPKETLAKSTKVGLQNITDRYGLITNKNVEIQKNNKTFTVRLPLLKNIEIMTTNNKDFENNSYIKAVERVGKIKEFYQNLITYVVMMPFLVFINLRFSPQFHWFWFPMFGWGMGVLFHGLEAYNYSMFLGKNWEEKKIKELMNDE